MTKQTQSLTICDFCDELLDDDQIITDIWGGTIDSHMEQLEYELRGAWRAGYDWLHIYNPAPDHSSDISAEYTLATCVLPTHSKRVPRPNGFQYRHSYDLRNVSKSEMDTARRIGERLSDE